jgi:signal transduction histidine kinase
MASTLVWAGRSGRGTKKANNGQLADANSKIKYEGSQPIGSPEDDRAPMFRLLRFYAVASAAAFILVSVLLIVSDRLHEFDKLVEAVERQNVGVAHSFANVIWPRFSSYAVTASKSDGENLRSRHETQELNDAVLQLTGGLPVLRIKVYDRQGRTLYSSHRAQIGTLYREHSTFLAAASDGSPRSQYIHRHEFMTAAGPVQHRDIVESYLPIWGTDDKIDGILEIYGDITQDLRLLDHRTVELAITVVSVFTALYLILFVIVRRANTIVGQQYACVLRSRIDLDRQNTVLSEEIAEREKLTRNLHRSEQKFRRLSDRLIVAQEEERTRISRELHDGIGQGLTDIKTRVERAMDYLLTRSRKDARDYLESVAGAVKSNMEEVRRISMGLRPSILDDLGILATLSWACRSFCENHPEIEVTQLCGVAEQEVSEIAKTVIYRTLQEGLNNIVRHSGATRVRIRLDKRNGRIRFTISDNGKGMAQRLADAPDPHRPTLGICSLRERAQNSGGIFRLRSIMGKGTTIRVTWPLCDPAGDAIGPAGRV